MQRANLFLATILSLTSLTALADNTLRSKAIKESVCVAIENKVDLEVPSFSSTQCLAGKFLIARTITDPRTNTVTMMDINFTVTMAPYEIAGTTRVAALLRPDTTGRMVQSWLTQNTTAKVTVTGDIMASLKALFAADRYDLFSTHNGDYSLDTLPGYTVAKAKKALAESLSNDPDSSCKYSTYEGVESVVGDLLKEDGTNEDVSTLLTQLMKNKKIKGAVTRGYEDGESEYCSHYYYTIIFTDGSVLFVNYDRTT
jgi:hypothetical protein